MKFVLYSIFSEKLDEILDFLYHVYHIFVNEMFTFQQGLYFNTS